MIGYKKPLGKAMMGFPMPLGKARLGSKMPLIIKPVLKMVGEEVVKRAVNSLERNVLKR